MAPDIYNHMWGPSEFTATGLLRTHDRTEVLKDIRVPALYLCGEYDEARPDTIRAFHEMTPGSKMHIVQGAAHVTMHDAPGVDAAVIKEFLGGL